MNRLERIFWLIFILVLVGFVSQVQGYSAYGKTLDKDWCGATSTVHDITVTYLETNTLLYSGSLAGFPSSFPNLLHNSHVEVNWTDWRGPQSEIILVECQDNVEHVTNTIPIPKYAE